VGGTALRRAYKSVCGRRRSCFVRSDECVPALFGCSQLHMEECGTRIGWLFRLLVLVGGRMVWLIMIFFSVDYVIDNDMRLST